MPAWSVVHAGEVELVEAADPIASGLLTADLIGPADGAVHLQVSLCHLGPGGTVGSHVHPFEESFYVLDGEAVVTIADQKDEVGPGSFGFAPVGTAHRWSNPSDETVVWVRTRSPQPKVIGGAAGTHPVPDHPAGTAAVSPRPSPHLRSFVGRFEERMMPTPGPIQMKGFRSAAANNVAVWMLVDEVFGAIHHTKFLVRFHPTETPMTLGGQHFHPFEETYYITGGRAVAHLEDESIEVGSGDVVFAGVGALHGFSNLGTEPVEWIEMQAPMPPPSGAFFFRSDWEPR